MKKILFILVAALLFITGCGGGSSLSFSVENSPSYVDSGESEITVRAEEEGVAVSDVDIKGTLEMARMDHGVIEVTFTDNGDGTYTAMVDLPMGGEWIIAIDAELNSSTYEEVITFKVNEG